MSFELELDECVAPLHAQLTGDSVALSGVSIDTRTLKPGELYIAIAGERFNGHDFVEAATDAGAAAIMVHEDVECALPQLRVSDTQSALGLLSKFWVQRFTVPTIAITGSNGKTTVKEIIASILSQIGPVLFTQGNLNNELGVPLTLLNMRKEHLYAVIEMGANHAGEIARLVALAEPDVAVVTNIGTAHLEGFGSVQGIARAKSEIYAGLQADGYGVINADDEFADVMRAACAHCRVREFGRGDTADVIALPGAKLDIESLGTNISPRFRLMGEHNVMNALAAVAAVQCLDVEAQYVVAGLEAMSPVPGRLEKKSGSGGAVIIDDSYNANPDSVRSAIRVLSACSGKRFLVLGDMGELGPNTLSMHRLTGEFADTEGLDGLWTIGELSRQAHEAFHDQSANENEQGGKSGGHFDSQATLINDLRCHLGSDVTVLVKGSRSSGMEAVVRVLTLPASADDAMSAGDRP